METRAETVNRIMLELLSNEENSRRHYRQDRISDEEASMWALANGDTVRNAILPTDIMTHFIRIITDEIRRLSSIMPRMNVLKQSLLQIQQDREQRERQQQQVNGGFSRRTKHSKKHSKKSRKTKSRRH